MVLAATAIQPLQWNWEPSVLLGMMLVSVAYAYAAGPLRRRRQLGPPVRPAQRVYLALAVLVLFAALISPLDHLGDTYLFSAHMVQHLLLASVWPPLVLLALPDWMVRPLLQRPVISPVLTFLTLPVVAIFAFNLDIYLWHLPVLYDLTLEKEQVHIAEHVTFMAFGLINWWPVLSPLREQRLSEPAQVIYLIADGMFMMGLGILFTFSPTVFYSAYQSAPRIWDISADSDQQVGGLIMWYPGNIPYAFLLCVAFYRWFDSGQTGPPHGSNEAIPYNESAPTPVR